MLLTKHGNSHSIHVPLHSGCPQSMNHNILPTRKHTRTAPLDRSRSAGARAIIAALGTCSVLALSACTIDTGAQTPPSGAASQSTEKQAANATSESGTSAGLKASVKPNATNVSVAEKITVTSPTPITKVTITNTATGAVAKGTLSDDKLTWTLVDDLGYNNSYSLTATAGTEKLAQTFTTTKATSVNGASVAPMDGSTVGVAQTVSFYFDAPVENKKAVEDAITITTNNGTEGAFYWLNGQALRWRPQEFWKPGTEVTVDAKLYGTNMGGGAYGGKNHKVKFTIGDDVRAVVDDATKIMTVTKNGEAIKTMPVSNGRDDAKWATPNGIYPVGDQHESLMMDSTTYGFSLEDGGYQTKVKYATQMSWSGIYIHGAPWSEWAQGNTNTSHGCINVSDANAKWVYDNLKRGDVVIVKNTVGGEFSSTDGAGDWQVDWATWKAGNR